MPGGKEEHPVRISEAFVLKRATAQSTVSPFVKFAGGGVKGTNDSNSM